MYVLLVLAILGFLAYFYLNKKNWKNSPPGPWGLPFIGNLLQLGEHPHLKFMDYVKTYGNIFIVKFGTNRLVVLSDLKMIKEAFNDMNFAGRLDLDLFKVLPGGSHGIVNSEGSEWMEQRRFTMRALRDLGFGKRSMEGLILDEVNELVSFLKETEGMPVALERRFNVAILNAIWGILSSGNRLQHDDQRFIDLFDGQNNVLEKMARNGTLFVSGLAKLFPNLTGWNQLLKLVEDMRSIFKEHVEQHKETYQESEPRDFIDVYLKEIKSNTDDKSSFYKAAGEHSLTAVIGDFFAAGPDTTSSTLTWALLYLSKFPAVRQKVQEELDAVVGTRQPTLEDRAKLPYVLATLEEVMRMSSIVPLGVFHRVVDSVDFHGYNIQKGDWVCANQYYLHFSENIWNNPKNFDPSRHLTNDGKFKRNEAFMAFGYGKRACVGESLARDAFFLFFTSIFHAYVVQLATESLNVTFDAKPNFVLPPQEFKVVVKSRILR